MDLLIAGVVLFLLFVATYSQRRTWIAFGSAALTAVLITGAVIVSTAQGPSQVHEGLAQLARSLPAGWDRPALQVTAAIEQASTSLARIRKDVAAHEPSPVLTASVTEWLSFGSWFKTESETETEDAVAPADAPETKAEPAANTGIGKPIKWFLDDPSAAASETFAVRGANVSDQPLKVVRAVLKPDSGAGKVKLRLAVEGHDGTDAVIPPGARFRLEAAGLTASEVETFGGAILSFAYAQAGRRKSSIMYLTPAVLAQDEE